MALTAPQSHELPPNDEKPRMRVALAPRPRRWKGWQAGGLNGPSIAGRCDSFCAKRLAKTSGSGTRTGPTASLDSMRAMP